MDCPTTPGAWALFFRSWASRKLGQREHQMPAPPHCSGFSEMGPPAQAPRANRCFRDPASPNSNKLNPDPLIRASSVLMGPLMRSSGKTWPGADVRGPSLLHTCRLQPPPAVPAVVEPEPWWVTSFFELCSVDSNS